MSDVIEVSEQWVDEVRASRADVEVVVEGQHLFTGNAAMKKAEDVSRLVLALEDIGIDEVELVGIQAYTSSGLFGRHSSASYSLRARVEDVELLPLVFEVITSQDQATLSRIEWEFEPTPEETSAWLESCVGRARHSARAIAGAMGATIVGMTRCEAKVLGRRRIEREACLSDLGASAGAYIPPVRRARAGTLHLGGTQLAPRRAMGVAVDIAFTIES